MDASVVDKLITLDSKDRPDILIVVQNGVILHVSATQELNVAVLEMFENTNVPLVTQSVTNKMAKDQMTSTVEGAINLGNMKAALETENQKETQNG